MYNEIIELIANNKMGSMIKEYFICECVKTNQNPEYYDEIKQILLSNKDAKIKEGELMVFFTNS